MQDIQTQNLSASRINLQKNDTEIDFEEDNNEPVKVSPIKPLHSKTRTNSVSQNSGILASAKVAPISKNESLPEQDAEFFEQIEALEQTKVNESKDFAVNIISVRRQKSDNKSKSTRSQSTRGA